MKDKDEKREQIIETISNQIGSFSSKYRSGPELYFYLKVLKLRREVNDISSFLSSDYNIEILYATLLSWDMNGRGAKMEYFDQFKASLISCEKTLAKLNRLHEDRVIDFSKLVIPLIGVYEKMNLMKTESRLVSNSKVLHFLFPNMLMPMDRTNTLSYFYGNTSESLEKYLEVIGFSCKIMQVIGHKTDYFDEKWNSTFPKLVDNAIIMLMNKSIT